MLSAECAIMLRRAFSTKRDRGRRASSVVYSGHDRKALHGHPGWAPPGEGGRPLTPTAALGVVVTALGLAATLVAEAMGRRTLRYLAKPSASTGFLIVALGSGALDSGYGRWVLAALVLSLLGDVLLMFRDTVRFLAGLVAFLLGHVAYIVAFAVLGVRGAWVAAAGAGVVLVGAIVLRWLMPHVAGGMRGPVLAYVAVISCMVALAVGTLGADETALIVAGAALFYVSDLFVARERFVAPAFANRLVGLPLYYGGQVLLALSVGA